MKNNVQHAIVLKHECYYHDLSQWRSQNAHQRETTGSSSRVLLRPSIAFFFKMGTPLKGKNLLPEGANCFL